jgi:hypothetical protein
VAHPRPEPFNKLKALSSIEGLGLKAVLTFEGGKKSPLRVDKKVIRSYKSKIFGKRGKTILRSFI